MKCVVYDDKKSLARVCVWNVLVHQRWTPLQSQLYLKHHQHCHYGWQNCFGRQKLLVLLFLLSKHQYTPSTQLWHTQQPNPNEIFFIHLAYVEKVKCKKNDTAKFGRTADKASECWFNVWKKKNTHFIFITPTVKPTVTILFKFHNSNYFRFFTRARALTSLIHIQPNRKKNIASI